MELAGDVVPDAARPVLEKYLQEIIRWNDRIGLVSKQTLPTVLPRLLRQSIDLLTLLDRNETSSPRVPRRVPHRVIDIGSGGGFPGVIWAIASPDIEVLLVERREKKAVFLEMLPRKLGLDNLSVRHADSSQLALESVYAHAFDVVTTMGVGSPAHSVSLALPFLESRAWLATARPLRDEPDPPPPEFSLLDSLETADSRLVIYRRDGE